MAESSAANSAAEEKGCEGSSPESGPPRPGMSRVQLLDTMVDTFLQKLVAAGSYKRFTHCYKRFYQLQPDMTQRIYDKFITQLQTSIRQRDTLRQHVQKQEAKNRQLAEAVLAGRRQVEDLQLQVQARQQAWQALRREQRELVTVLREPE
ncbi:polyamine-modulated factor 1-like isoform X3 [Ochotona curzoniae]|uniref:polyamine-modulated factor 1-like isoform X3 n=1 Tax=Ochotona curzoniae TaxID=130825 RepID=UPI001B345875|nr:polyamine-modulated factor 1-like isoform X3 [Ochotona curzoniae]